MSTSRRRPPRRLPTITTVLVAGLALTACAGGGTDAGAEPTSAAIVEGGTLAVAVGGTVTCLDPWQTDTPAEMNIYRQQVETLTSIDPADGTLRPWLAESWTPNADATSFDFTLREGVHFADGTELTADVIKANFDNAAVLPQAVRGPSYLAGYTGTTVTDPLNFTVTFSEPNSSFLNRTGSTFLGILSSATIASTAEERCSTGVVGTGPFAVESYAPNQEVVLAKRADYDSAPTWAAHSGAAHLDSIVFSLVPESSSRLGLLTSGQVDIVQSLEAQDFATAEASGATVQSKETPGIPFRLQFNTQNSFFGNEAVRKAISLYINRDEINDVVFDGNASPAVGLLTESVPGYLDQSDVIRFDPEAGDSLLEDDGWKKDADGIWAKDGQKLEFPLIKASPYSAVPPLLELVVQQLHTAGIEMTFSDYTGDFATLTKTHDYDVLFSNTTDVDGDVLRGQLSPLAGNRSNLLPDAAITADLTKQNQIGDIDERNTLLASIQETVIDEAIQVPIVPLVQFYGVAQSVTGVSYDAESRLSLYDASLTDAAQAD